MYEIVAEEFSARRFRTAPRKHCRVWFDIRFEDVALNQIDIEVTIVIEIKQRPTATRDLGQVNFPVMPL